jgi:6-phosphogluconolactonase (cycloisomerase 2 family)
MPRLTRLSSLVAVLSMCACGGDRVSAPTGTPSPTPPPQHRLLAVTDDSIESFTVDAVDGHLSPAPRMTPGSRSSAAVVMPSGDHLYVTTLNGLEGFRMNATSGVLTSLAGSPYAQRVFGLSLAPSGAFLYSYTSQRAIVAFRVEPSGALVEVGRTAGAQFQTPVEVEPGGRYAYGFGNFSLTGYRVEASGVLTALPGSPYPLPSTDPNAGGLRMARVGPFFYVLSQGAGASRPGGILVYRFDALTGIPEQVARYGAPEERVPSAVDISPSGGTLYVSFRPRLVTDAAPVYVQAFAVDGSTGLLGPTGRLDVGQSIFSLMRVSPDGRGLFLTLEPSRFDEPFPPTQVAAVRLDAAGQPAAVAGQPQSAGLFPHSLLSFAR